VYRLLAVGYLNKKKAFRDGSPFVFSNKMLPNIFFFIRDVGNYFYLFLDNLYASEFIG
jgi:hypothetical protein